MGRSPRSNPFQPGWGKPLVWAGREAIVADFVDVVAPRVHDGVKEAPRLLQDERGMGKTALLESIRDEAQERGSVVVMAPAARGENFTKAFSRALDRAAADRSLQERLAAAASTGLRRLAGLSVAGTSIDLAGPAEEDVASLILTDALIDVARLARADGSQVVVLIDEVQNVGLGHLAAVFTALQAATEQTEPREHPAGGILRLALPIAVYLAGLPGSLARFKAARVTFGERCELVELGPLSERDVRAALVTFDRRNDEGVVFDSDAVDRFVEEVSGYPYAFQLLGKAAWDASDGPVITAADVAAAALAIRPSMRERFAARLAGLTDDQIDFLAAAASLPRASRSATAVCRAWLGDAAAPASRCGGMSQRLINDHQVMRRSRDGVYEFCLPGMDRYLADLHR